MGAGYVPGTVMAPIVGILCITTEYRQKVLTTTLLVTPRREVVLLAKAVAAAIWGLGLAVATLVLVAAMGIPLLVAEGGSVSALLHQAGPVIPGLFGEYVLMAIFGLGIGTLLRNQVAAVVLAIVFIVILEQIIVALVHGLAHVDLNWLPSRSAAALAGGSDPVDRQRAHRRRPAPQLVARRPCSPRLGRRHRGDRLLHDVPPRRHLTRRSTANGDRSSTIVTGSPPSGRSTRPSATRPSTNTRAAAIP